MSRDRTRLNIMISEQTGAAPRTPAPGRTTRVDEEELQDEQAQAPLEQGTRRRSVFDAPHVDDVARAPAAPAPDDDAPGDT